MIGLLSKVNEYNLFVLELESEVILALNSWPPFLLKYLYIEYMHKMIWQQAALITIKVQKVPREHYVVALPLLLLLSLYPLARQHLLKTTLFDYFVFFIKNLLCKFDRALRSND